MEGVPLIVKTWLGSHIILVWSDAAFAYICGRKNPLIQTMGDAEGKFRSSSLYDIITFHRGPRGPVQVLIYNNSKNPISLHDMTVHYASIRLPLPRICSLSPDGCDISALYDLAPNDDALRALFRETRNIPTIPSDFDIDMDLMPVPPSPSPYLDDFMFCSSRQCSSRLDGEGHTCLNCLSLYCGMACLNACTCGK